MSEKKQSRAYAFVDELARQIEERSAEFAGEYAVNEPNMDHFRKLCYFFHWAADDTGGEIERVEINPETNRATVAMDVPLVELRGDELNRFMDILQTVDTFSVKHTGEDSLLIEASVSHVWDTVS